MTHRIIHLSCSYKSQASNTFIAPNQLNLNNYEKCFCHVKLCQRKIKYLVITSQQTKKAYKEFIALDEESINKTDYLSKNTLMFQ